MTDFWAPAAVLCNPPCGRRTGPGRKQSGSGGGRRGQCRPSAGPQALRNPPCGPRAGPDRKQSGPVGGRSGQGRGTGVRPGRLSVSRSGGCQPALRFPSPALSEVEAGDIFEGPPRARPRPWGAGRSQMPVANRLNADSMVGRKHAPIYLWGRLAAPPLVYSIFGVHRFSASVS